MSTQAITISTSTAAGQNAQRSLLSFVASFLVAVFSAIAFLGAAGPTFLLSFILAQNKAVAVDAGESKKALDAPPTQDQDQVVVVVEDEDTSERSEPSPPLQGVASKVLKSRLTRSSAPQTPALSVSSLSDADVVSPITQDETEPDYFTTSSLIDAKEGLVFVTDKAFPEPHSTGPNISIAEIGEEEIFSAPVPVVDVVKVQLKHVAGGKPKEPKVSSYSAPVEIRPAPVQKLAVEPRKTFRILPLALALTLSKRAKKKAKAAIKRSMSASSEVVEPLPLPVLEAIIVPRSPGPFLTVTRIKKFKKAYRVHHGQPLRTEDARMEMMERGWQAVKELLGDRY